MSSLATDSSTQLKDIKGTDFKVFAEYSECQKTLKDGKNMVFLWCSNMESDLVKHIFKEGFYKANSNGPALSGPKGIRLKSLNLFCDLTSKLSDISLKTTTMIGA